MKIPREGRSADAVEAALAQFKASDLDWKTGRAWAYVYDAGDEIDAVTKRAFTSFLSENALDPTAFPSLLALENEVVAMMATHLGRPDAVGSMTSGGTESLILAMKTARDHARAHRPDVRRPNVVLPDTAHASFHKAAHYLDVELRVTPVDASFRANVEAMRDAIDDQTVMLAGSAVSYAHGVVDPIEKIASLAAARGLLCHVDACIGGFVLPYFRRLGGDVPAFDLSVDGVTSISCDLHKYGFAPKGSSVILYRDAALRAHQIYACSAWSGYTVVNTTVQSTKSGGPLAGAWAALNFIGDDGYMRLFGRMYDATRRICAGIDAHPDLFLLAPPDANLVAIGSNTVDVFHVCDEMRVRNWFIQPQLSFAGSPKNFHLSINPKADGWVDAFLADLDDSVQAARSLPSGNLRTMIEAMMAAPGGLDAEALMGALGVDGPALPSRMAPINEVLDALPPAIRERLLVDFVNRLYAPRT